MSHGKNPQHWYDDTPVSPSDARDRNLRRKNRHAVSRAQQQARQQYVNLVAQSDVYLEQERQQYLAESKNKEAQASVEQSAAEQLDSAVVDAVVEDSAVIENPKHDEENAEVAENEGDDDDWIIIEE